MWLEVGTLHTKVARCDDAERDWLAEYLSFEDRKYKGGRWQVKKGSLLNLYTSSFPSGFVSMVRKAGKEAGWSIQLIDHRVPPCTPDPSADLEWLRDYQLDSVRAIVNRHRGILWLPTGAGKTEVAVGLTRALPCRWLAVVHNKQLADDIASRYEKRTPGVTATRVLDGKWIPGDGPLTSCTFQTIHAALKAGVYDPEDEKYLKVKELLANAEGLLVDECHTLPANTFYKAAMMTPKAYYRVGLSGTPLARGDRKSLYSLGAIGPVVHRVKTQLLVERGVLSKPTVRMVTCYQKSARPTWQGVYGELVVRSSIRNTTVCGMAMRATKPGLLFVKEIDHGRSLVKLLARSGVSADFVWGSHSLDYRKSLIRRLVQSHFEVLVCSSVFDMGIDIPELRSVIIGSGGKSLIAALQRLGRGMRVDRNPDGSVREGGDRFEVWDVFDDGNEWLKKHARARRNAYANEGFETYVEPAPIPTVTTLRANDTVIRLGGSPPR